MLLFSVTVRWAAATAYSLCKPREDHFLRHGVQLQATFPAPREARETVAPQLWRKLDVN